MDSQEIIESCLYSGHVSHRRSKPEHQFRYGTTWAYLDLQEVDRIVHSSWWIGGSRLAAASFQRTDHFGDPSLSMTDAVRSFVAEKTATRFDGPIRLLTQLRHFGIYFSPINVFYCFNRDGSLAAMVAEVSNTPWKERHCYVLWSGNRVPNSKTRYVHPKEFHVSPFMGMDSEYHWKIGRPGEKLDLSLGCCRDGERTFHADLHLERRPLTDTNLFLGMMRRPVAAAKILSAIYFEAFRLWMKKCQFYPHPANSRASNSNIEINSIPAPKVSTSDASTTAKQASDGLAEAHHRKDNHPTTDPSPKNRDLVAPR